MLYGTIDLLFVWRNGINFVILILWLLCSLFSPLISSFVYGSCMMEGMCCGETLLFCLLSVRCTYSVCFSN